MKTFLIIVAIFVIAILAIGISETKAMCGFRRMIQRKYDTTNHLFMTENDHKLIRIAQSLPSNCYTDIHDLIKKADTEECRRQLRNILDLKYHQDEYDAGML